MTRLVLAMILAVTSTFVGINVAAAASNPNQPQKRSRCERGQRTGNGLQPLQTG